MNYSRGLNPSKFNLFYLFFCIIWTPFHTYYFHIDGTGRILTVLSVLAMLININYFLKKKELFLSNAMICWTILTLYSFFNSLLKGIVTAQTNMSFFTFNFLMPYTFLSVAIVEISKNKSLALKVFLFSFFLYLVIGLTHSSYIDEGTRMLSEMGNLVPLICVGLLFVISLLKSERLINIRRWLYIGSVIVLAVIIVASGTRKALGGFVILIIGMVFFQLKKFDFRSMLLIVSTVVVLHFGLNWMIDNTFMGKRIVESQEKYDVPLVDNKIINDFLMSLLGDRAWQYYYGIELYHTNPITGIGLNHFETAADYVFRLHTEYMVQLCENGLIGFSLLMLFYVCLFKGLRKSRKKGYNTSIYLFGLIAVLFINLTAWTYNVLYVMVIYACIITQGYDTRNLIKRQVS